MLENGIQIIHSAPGFPVGIDSDQANFEIPGNSSWTAGNAQDKGQHYFCVSLRMQFLLLLFILFNLLSNFLYFLYYIKYTYIFIYCISS